MNSINLTGRLTQDPDGRSTQSGTAVCSMRLAVQRQKSREGEERGAVFVDVTAFAGLADVCAKYLEKGRQVAVSGRLEHDHWQASDGTKRQRHYIVADAVEFLDGRQVGVDPFSEAEAASEVEQKPKRSSRKAA